jgi:hypothetical protein
MKNQRIENCLRQIAAKHHGMLAPEDVVDEAKSQKHPLHAKFQWDNTQAAHEYRLWQARQLIRVCVEVVASGLDPSPVFVSVSTDRGHAGGGYRVTADVMSDAELRNQLLKDALFELNCFQRKYAQLRELAEVFSAARKISKVA